METVDKQIRSWVLNKGLESPHYSSYCEESKETIKSTHYFSRKVAGGGSGVVGMWNVYLSNPHEPFCNIRIHEKQEDPRQ